jgi:hypothetical protein
MPIYKCPRCRGNDVYFANRQEVRSTGGPFGEAYTVDVKKPFCRPCGEPMDNLGPTPEEARASAAATEKTISFLTSKLGIFLIVVAILLAGLIIYGIYSGINGWVQCMDGYNYESEVVDGETLYLNQCDAY